MGEFLSPIAALIFLQVGSALASAPVPAAAMAFAAAVAALHVMAARLVARAEVEDGLLAGRLGRPPRRYLRLLATFGPLATYAALCFGTDWGASVAQWSGGWPWVDRLLGFAPYVFGRLAAADGVWRVRRRHAHSQPSGGAGQQAESPSAAMGLALRMLFMIVGPLIILQGALDALLLWPRFALAMERAPVATEILSLVPLLILAFAASPFLIRLLLGARPLPGGPLRDRLLAYNKANGFHPRDILLWRTRAYLPNALYIGLHPRLSYVVLTDALVARLDDAAIEGVYAHEAGHGQRGHLAWNLALVLCVAFLSAWMQLGATDLLGLSEDSGATSSQKTLAGIVLGGAHIALLLAFVFGGLGWLSRRFEVEADAHATGTASDPSGCSRALFAIGRDVGQLEKSGGFRHPPIARRIAWMNRFVGEASWRERLRRRGRTIRWGLGLLLLLSASLFAVEAPREWRDNAWRAAYLQSNRALEAGEFAVARAGIEHGLSLSAREPWSEAEREAVPARGATSPEAAAPNFQRAQLLGLAGDIALAQLDFDWARALSEELDVFRLPRAPGLQASPARAPSKAATIADFNARRLGLFLEVLELAERGAVGGDKPRAEAPSPARTGAAAAVALAELAQDFEELHQRIPQGENAHVLRSELLLAFRAAGGTSIPIAGPRGSWTALARLVLCAAAPEEASAARPPNDAGLQADARRHPWLAMLARRALEQALAAEEAERANSGSHAPDSGERERARRLRDALQRSREALAIGKEAARG